MAVTLGLGGVLGGFVASADFFGLSINLPVGIFALTVGPFVIDESAPRASRDST
ncbi:hypothetical protein [Bradyrhizobium genosp. P]|uniref:hypothetical protein n=1 Tax=Bradyrhizobium genosp. P TaxID=83641 RepID=UPI003CFADF5B